MGSVLPGHELAPLDPIRIRLCSGGDEHRIDAVMAARVPDDPGCGPAQQAHGAVRVAPEQVHVPGPELREALEELGLVAPPGLLPRGLPGFVSGEEPSGIEVRAPLATHTGWTLRHPDIGGAEQLLVFAGGTLPFARTRQAREASADPRPSIAERYPSREAYLERVRRAALELVASRHLLEEDVELSVTIATRMWDWLAGGAPSEPAR